MEQKVQIKFVINLSVPDQSSATTGKRAGVLH